MNSVGRVAQSVLRLTRGWTVRDRNPVWKTFSARPDRPWGPPSLLYNGYRVFPGVKVRPGSAADHSPPSSAAVMEEYSYTSTHPLGNTGPVTGKVYLFFYENLILRRQNISLIMSVVVQITTYSCHKQCTSNSFTVR